MQLFRIISALSLLSAVLGAQAALIDRGGGFIYDDLLEITWTQNANIRDGEGPLGDGRDIWDNQVAWAASLSLFDSVRNVTWSDWRLPRVVQPDPSCSAQVDPGGGFPVQGFGHGCTRSEMGHLANVYGIGASPDSGLFTNVQFYPYWSDTTYAPSPLSAWYSVFVMPGQSIMPHQSTAYKDLEYYYAWAVRDGDVATLPEPATVWLFGLGLGLLVWTRR